MADDSTTQTTALLGRGTRFVQESLIVRCSRSASSLIVQCARSASPDRTLTLFIFLLLFAIYLAFTVCSYMMRSQPELFPDYVGPLSVVVLEVAGILCMLLMFSVRTRPHYHDADDADLQPWHRFVKRNIKLFGIVLFFFAIVFYDCLRMLANGRCFDAWIACRTRKIRVGHFVDFVYSAVRILYVFFEMVVCMKFNEADLHQNTLVLIGLAVVQATNFSAWLDALLEKSFELTSSRHNATYELLECLNASIEKNLTIGNHTGHLEKCFKSTTSEYELVEKATPYLYPFVVEYLMLVIECVAAWFFSDAQPNPDGTASSTGSSVRAQPAFAIASTSHDDEFTSPASSANSHSGLDRAHDTRWTPCPWFFVFLVLASIPSLLLVFFQIVNHDTGGNVYESTLTYYLSFYWLTLLVAAAVGYAASGRFPSTHRNPSNFEYFVIISSVGPVLLSIFTIVASVQVKIAPHGTIPCEIMHILHIGTQLAFYTHAKSVQVPTDTDNETTVLRRKRLILIGVLFYFSLCNFAIWVADSFIEPKTWSWQNVYYEEWPVFYNVLNPVDLMFRFNIVLLFLNVLFDKRRQQ